MNVKVQWLCVNCLISTFTFYWAWDVFWQLGTRVRSPQEQSAAVSAAAIAQSLYRMQGWKREETHIQDIILLYLNLFDQKSNVCRSEHYPLSYNFMWTPLIRVFRLETALSTAGGTGRHWHCRQTLPGRERREERGEEGSNDRGQICRPLSHRESCQVLPKIHLSFGIVLI